MARQTLCLLPSVRSRILNEGSKHPYEGGKSKYESDEMTTQRSQEHLLSGMSRRERRVFLHGNKFAWPKEREESLTDRVMTPLNYSVNLIVNRVSKLAMIDYYKTNENTGRTQLKPFINIRNNACSITGRELQIHLLEAMIALCVDL